MSDKPTLAMWYMRQSPLLDWCAAFLDPGRLSVPPTTSDITSSQSKLWDQSCNQNLEKINKCQKQPWRRAGAVRHAKCWTHLLPLNAGDLELRAPCRSSDRAVGCGHSGAPHDWVGAPALLYKGWPAAVFAVIQPRRRATPSPTWSRSASGLAKWQALQKGDFPGYVRTYNGLGKVDPLVRKRKRNILACFSEKKKRYTPWTLICSHTACTDIWSGKTMVG
jgi:hypothetical protein